jgi:hypothetical protein
MKITALEESADFATLDTEKLFSKLKSHELSRKGRSNHDASLTSKTFVTSTHVGGHVANPTNTIDSSTLEFALSSLCAASDEQYESILDDKIALLVCLIVPGWNSESSKLVPHFWVPALVVRCLDLIWRLLLLTLKILSTNLIILLATLFYPLLMKHVSL